MKRRYAALIFMLATIYIAAWTIVAFAMGFGLLLNPLASVTSMTWLGWLVILANPAVIVGVAIWLKSFRDRKARNGKV